MTGSGKAARVEIRAWQFLSGQVESAPSSVALTIPDDCTIVEIDAEGDACYYAINQGGAGPGSHGYVPAEGARLLGPLSNLNSLHVDCDGTVHILYFKEA